MKTVMSNQLNPKPYKRNTSKQIAFNPAHYSLGLQRRGQRDPSMFALIRRTQQYAACLCTDDHRIATVTFLKFNFFSNPLLKWLVVP